MRSVSVVIPAFNRSRLLARCLESLVHQTYKDFNVVIVDDGSSEDFGKILTTYSHLIDIKYLKIQNFGGPAKPRNIGISMSSSSYVAFLDSDDYWLPSKLQQSVEALDSGFDLVYHDLIHIRNGKNDFEGLRRRPFRSRIIKSGLVFDSLVESGNFLPLSSVVIRSSLLNKRFFSEDKNVISGEDYLAWIYLSFSRRLRLKRIGKPLGFYEIGFDGNISSLKNADRQYQVYSFIYKSCIQLKGCNLSLGDYLLYRYTLSLYKLRKHSVVIDVIQGSQASLGKSLFKNFLCSLKTLFIYYCSILKTLGHKE